MPTRDVNWDVGQKPNWIPLVEKKKKRQWKGCPEPLNTDTWVAVSDANILYEAHVVVINENKYACVTYLIACCEAHVTVQSRKQNTCVQALMLQV